ncbi:MAG: hypothetical protein AAGB32_01850 [Pseudomonadota bacterium]
MVRYVAEETFDQAYAAYSKGVEGTLEAWKILAEAGDTYAVGSYYIGSDKRGFWTSMRQAHWRLATGLSMGDDQWHQAARSSLGFYLDKMKEKRFPLPSGQKMYPLPTSKEIEECHIRSIEKHGLPKHSIIHLVANTISTPFNSRFERAMKYVNVCVNGPDWHEILARDFGSMERVSPGTMGTRGVDNSINVTGRTVLQDAWLLARAAARGAASNGWRYIGERASAHGFNIR